MENNEVILQIAKELTLKAMDKTVYVTNVAHQTSDMESAGVKIATLFNTIYNGIKQ